MDTVILGCTHYPLVRPMLQRFLGRGVEIVTSGAPVARQVEHVLGARGLGSPQEGEGDYSFLCTGDAEALPRARHALPAAAARARSRRCRARGTRARGVAPREPRAQRRARRRRAAADDDRARLRRDRDRLGADQLRRHARDLHRLRAGVRAALDARAGPRLADRRVRDAPRLDGRAQAARRHARAAPTAARSRSSA